MKPSNQVFEGYVQSLEERTLVFQRCADCQRPQFYPRSLCSNCWSRRLSWERAAGRGTVHSYSVLHRSPDANREIPYIVGLVDLEEGVRVMGIIDDGVEPLRSCEAEVEFARAEMRDEGPELHFRVVSVEQVGNRGDLAKLEHMNGSAAKDGE